MKVDTILVYKNNFVGPEKSFNKDMAVEVELGLYNYLERLLGHHLKKAICWHS
jgi:hypothetical protein